MKYHDPLHVVILVGSNRQGRFAPVVARWVRQSVEARGDMTVGVVDLEEVRLPDRLADPAPPEVAVVGRRLAAADAFIVVTPEYNHSFPAVLKNAIDWYSGEWRRKPVGFVSYGGISGGLRAVEQLRLVFAELHAVTVRDAVSFHGAYAAFDGEGIPLDQKRANRAADAMLEQIAWWGNVLREGRAGNIAALSAGAAR